MSECDDRKEITLEELAAAKKAGASLADVQVTGLVKIIDKHGKVIGVNPKRYTLIGNAG